MSGRVIAVVAGITVLLSSCGSPAPAVQSSSAYQGSITVLAAASLTAAFTAIGADFEKTFSGTTVQFAFAGSSTLVAQIQLGAAGDVFASADQSNMQKLAAGGLVMGTPTTFARNSLAIAVRPGNPKHITGLADLASPGLIVVLCAPAVPCGRYAAQALKTAGVSVNPASQEVDVSAVLSKVAIGEADAGIVYRTDIKAAGSRVQGVDIAPDQNVVAVYPIAVLKSSPNLRLAKAFVAFVLEDVPAGPSGGQPTLARYGFLPP